MTNATTRSFWVHGTLGSQGGAGDCGVPEGATAVSINLTAISQGGTTGFVRGWAAGSAPSTSTLLNFSPALNASNSVEVPLCTASCTSDITLKTFGSAQVIGEVLGYFVPQIRGEVGPGGALNFSTSRVRGSERLQKGIYLLELDRDVSTCSVVGSVSDNDPGSVSVYTTSAKSMAAWVYGPDGELEDLEWNFQVSC